MHVTFTYRGHVYGKLFVPFFWIVSTVRIALVAHYRLGQILNCPSTHNGSSSFTLTLVRLCIATPLPVTAPRLYRHLNWNHMKPALAKAVSLQTTNQLLITLFHTAGALFHCQNRPSKKIVAQCPLHILYESASRAAMMSLMPANNLDASFTVSDSCSPASIL